MRALFIMHYFEMEIMFYNAHISLIMANKALLWTDVFWISHLKRYKFYNNNLSVVLGTKQGGFWNSWIRNTRTERLIQFTDSLSLNFLVYFAEMSSYFSIKTNNEGGGELHEIKRSQNKTEVGKEIIC